YVAHFVLGFVHHYGEGSYPRALYHHLEALRLFETQYGSRPNLDQRWRWHARILRELAMTHGDLEHFREQLSLFTLHNELYEPDLLAQRAWPLMKMRRFDAARLSAREALQHGDPMQVEVALNALCAIEFEAGDDEASYTACKNAVDHAKRQGGASAVDLTNFAEASRSLFKLSEAERVLQEATSAPVSWYGNPWIELAELYTRQGRFPEALDALKKIENYRRRRPAHVRHVDRNEGRRAASAFLLVVGHAEPALELAAPALQLPDRRAHNSRDPMQDRAIAALIDRRARLTVAEYLQEQSSALTLFRGFFPRVWAFGRASWQRMLAWSSGRQAARALSDDERLVGFLRVGTSESAILPPWLAGEVVEVMGAGVAREAIRRARDRDKRRDASAYYDAFECETEFATSAFSKALSLCERSLVALGPSEVLLAARAHALAAVAAERLGAVAQSLYHFDLAFQRDPGVFRRLGIEVPVTVSARGSKGEEIASRLLSSPRFREGSIGALRLDVDFAEDEGRICLMGGGQTVLTCDEYPSNASQQFSSSTSSPSEGDQEPSTQSAGEVLIQGFLKKAFAPRMDLSQQDIQGLDGSNEVIRDPLELLLPPRR
ncbi:MAG: hypothetical protein AAF550_11200, partial [Myxococcota bacterium]